MKTFFLFLSQVSTSTGVVSHFVNLQVVVPEAFILGSGELHVDMGSAINLVCIIEKVRQAFVALIVPRLRVTSDSCPESFLTLRSLLRKAFTERHCSVET